MLAQEEARTYALAVNLTAELTTKAAKAKGTVPLLPELLNYSLTGRNT